VEAKEFLGLDVGEKRIGVARASALAMLAEPLTTIAAEGGLDKLKEMVAERGVGALVVGLPRNLSGDDTAQTTTVRDWVARAKQAIEKPFFWQDEALTSIAAAKLQATNSKFQTKDIDALAAAILLQDFLDAPESQRVLC